MTAVAQRRSSRSAERLGVLAEIAARRRTDIGASSQAAPSRAAPRGGGSSGRQRRARAAPAAGPPRHRRGQAPLPFGRRPDRAGSDVASGHAPTRRAARASSRCWSSRTGSAARSTTCRCPRGGTRAGPGQGVRGRSRASCRSCGRPARIPSCCSPRSTAVAATAPPGARGAGPWPGAARRGPRRRELDARWRPTRASSASTTATCGRSRSIRSTPTACGPRARRSARDRRVRRPRAGHVAGWRALGFDAALVGEELMATGDDPDAIRARTAAFVAAGRPPSPTEDPAAADRAPLVKICGVTEPPATRGHPCRRRRHRPELGAGHAARPGGAQAAAIVARHTVGRRPATADRRHLRRPRPGRRQCLGAPARPRRGPAQRRRAAGGPRPIRAAGLEGAPPAARCADEAVGADDEAAAATSNARGPTWPQGRQDHARHGRPARARAAPGAARRRAGRRHRPPGADRPRRRPRPGQRRGRAARDPGDRRGRGRRRRATTSRWDDRPRPSDGRPPKDPVPGRPLRQARPGRTARPPALGRPPDARRPGPPRARRPRSMGARGPVRWSVRARDADGGLIELEEAWDAVRDDPRFWAELRELGADYVGRPTPLYRADRLAAELERAAGRDAGRLRLYLKREDLTTRARTRSTTHSGRRC